MLIDFCPIRYNAEENIAISFIKLMYSPKKLKEMESDRNDFQAFFQSGEDFANFDAFKQGWLNNVILYTKIGLTQTAIQAMLPEWQRFVELRYHQNYMMQAIAMDIYASVGQINNWNHKILRKVYTYARQMKLDESDVFHRGKVLQLIDSYNRLIDFCARIDPDNRIIVKPWLTTLKRRQRNYRTILSRIDDCMRERKSGINNMVVAHKIDNPNDNYSIIATNLNIDKGQVSRIISKFISSISCYLD